jgi:hypothetical protein
MFWSRINAMQVRFACLLYTGRLKSIQVEKGFHDSAEVIEMESNT